MLVAENVQLPIDFVEIQMAADLDGYLICNMVAAMWISVGATLRRILNLSAFDMLNRFQNWMLIWPEKSKEKHLLLVS